MAKKQVREKGARKKKVPRPAAKKAVRKKRAAGTKNGGGVARTRTGVATKKTRRRAKKKTPSPAEKRTPAVRKKLKYADDPRMRSRIIRTIGLESDVLGSSVEMLSSVESGARIAPDHAPSARGTMGLVVSRGLQKLLLTCAHVVAGGSSSSIIDSATPIQMRAIPGGPIGLCLQGNGINWELDGELDCALIAPQGVVPLPGIPGVAGPLVFSRLTDADEENDISLTKFGAETGQTVGRIASIESPPITMADGSHAIGQIQIRSADDLPFAQPGDSGSVVLAGNRIVGLIRGIDSDGFVIACHMDQLADLLDIAIPN